MRRTERTLYEQMHISEIEIQNRKELLRIGKNELDLLVDSKPIIDGTVDAIVDQYYAIQTTNDDVSLLIGDSDTLGRLKKAQRKYVLDLFSGYYDNEYVNNRLRIGMVHKRIGVEPKLYLAGVKILKDIIYQTLESEIKDDAKLKSVYRALDKLIYFDTTLVFDTYIRSLISEIETARNRTEMYAQSLEEKVAERTRQLEELSRKDPLTGLFNQRALMETLRRDLAQAKRQGQPITLVYFDVDKFKEINDTQGHIAGDNLLRHIGSVLLSILREVDVPCRYGGDEFCVILPNCDTENSEKVCLKLIEEFKSKYPDTDLSIGVAQCGPIEFSDHDELIKQADSKMYEAKAEPGSQIRR